MVKPKRKPTAREKLAAEVTEAINLYIVGPGRPGSNHDVQTASAWNLALHNAVQAARAVILRGGKNG